MNGACQNCVTEPEWEEEDVQSDNMRMGALISSCVALGVDLECLTDRERGLIQEVFPVEVDVPELRAKILKGEDPLGDMFCALRSSAERRAEGQTFTPHEIVEQMVSWAANKAVPVRVVDPGTGSGRFIIRALKKFPSAKGIAIDTDPVALLIARANAHVCGLSQRIDFRLCDYREALIEKINGVTLYVGNPPYVRHHDIASRWKEWYAVTAKSLNLPSSKLAGLHAHFFLKTAKNMCPGDIGAFITSAEWLDVNYGSSLRKLLVKNLSLDELHVFDPVSLPFANAQVTGVVVYFSSDVEGKAVLVNRVKLPSDLGNVHKAVRVDRATMETSARWSTVGRERKKYPRGYVELGEYFRVRRGTVTGANKIWIARRGDVDLPDSVLFPSVTKARELFAAGESLTSDLELKCVVDIPFDYQSLDDDSVARIERYIAYAQSLGVDRGYIARHRRAWWSVGLAKAAPILATYMARRPPRFVRNCVGARHVNVVHGLYPRFDCTDRDLKLLVEYLNNNVQLSDGRTYAGGLTKFEPKEMERLMVPSFDLLREGC